MMAFFTAFNANQAVRLLGNTDENATGWLRI